MVSIHILNVNFVIAPGLQLWWIHDQMTDIVLFLVLKFNPVQFTHISSQVVAGTLNCFNVMQMDGHAYG
jgi:hypothetical protein